MMALLGHRPAMLRSETTVPDVIVEVAVWRSYVVLRVMAEYTLVIAVDVSNLRTLRLHA